MHKTINVRIITPINIIFEKPAKMVTMPGEEGMFGVLPRHVPLIASLEIGLTRIFTDNTRSPEIIYLIKNGMTEITGSKVDIVTEFAIDVTKLSETDILTKITELKAI